MTADTPKPDQSNPPQIAPIILVTSLNGRKPREINIQPDAVYCAELATHLGLSALRKLRFEGWLQPTGKQDWTVSGQLGATVVQPCAVTLAPVTTRIDTPLTRTFIADWSEPEGEEVEMTIDETLEPLGNRIDLSAVVIEALVLAIPDFPRAEGAGLSEDGVLRAAPEGESPLTDAAVKPFAGLAALRDKLDRG